jgi:hypothetical protein
MRSEVTVRWLFQSFGSTLGSRDPPLYLNPFESIAFRSGHDGRTQEHHQELLPSLHGSSAETQPRYGGDPSTVAVFLSSCHEKADHSVRDSDLPLSCLRFCIAGQLRRYGTLTFHR